MKIKYVILDIPVANLVDVTEIEIITLCGKYLIAYKSKVFNLHEVELENLPISGLLRGVGFSIGESTTPGQNDTLYLHNRHYEACRDKDDYNIYWTE